MLWWNGDDLKGCLLKFTITLTYIAADYIHAKLLPQASITRNDVTHVIQSDQYFTHSKQKTMCSAGLNWISRGRNVLLEVIRVD